MISSFHVDWVLIDDDLAVLAPINTNFSSNALCSSYIIMNIHGL